MAYAPSPLYRLELQSTDPKKAHTSQPWYVRDSRKFNRVGRGAPTNPNLAIVIEAYEDSTKKGGVNAHLGEDTIGIARIVQQATGEIVASYYRRGASQEFLAMLERHLQRQIAMGLKTDP